MIRSYTKILKLYYISFQFVSIHEFTFKFHFISIKHIKHKTQ